MPGKVNPTQEEAVVMVGIQVIGNDTAVAFAGSQGNFELNAMRPIILYNVLHSSTILADVCDRWREHSLEQITLDRARIDRFVGESLMLVTALSPVIGYDKAAHIAHEAHQKGMTLGRRRWRSGDVTAEQFDKVVVPRSMVGDPRKDVGLK
jgi:fumarate hydratase class II